MNKHHPLDEVFHGKLGDSALNPPMHLWEQIDQKRNWQHKVLNQIKLRKPISTLLAVAALTGICWVVWLAQNQEIQAFPIPVSVALFQHPAAGTTVSSDVLVQEHSVIEEHTAFGSVDFQQVAAALIADESPKHSTLAMLLANEASVASETAQATQKTTFATPSTVNALSVKMPGSVQSAELAMYEGLDASEPKCADFGTGNWRFYVEALASPDLTFRNLEAREPAFEEYAEFRNSTEDRMYAFSAALRLAMVSEAGLTMRTGINYSQINEKFRYVNGSEERVEIKSIFDNNGNVIGTDTIVVIGTRTKVTYNQYQMLDIPFLLGYEFEMDRLSLNVNAGAYLNLLFKQEGDFLSPQSLEPVSFDSGNPDAYPAFKQQAGLGWYGSVGVVYKLNPLLDLMIEPHFKVFPKSVTRDQYGLRQNYMSTGLFIGLRQQI
ncbi:MAG TPA: hypothetical protein PKA00_06780 [Saprospiraceae bacterium]|nr:hypothetical protein [Saprospiraceae bacterium]HMQ82592.1 hypothetical protein [Saprospiraceae bacterium]